MELWKCPAQIFLQKDLLQEHSWWISSSCCSFGTTVAFILKSHFSQALPSQWLSEGVTRTRPFLPETGFLQRTVWVRNWSGRDFLRTCLPSEVLLTQFFLLSPFSQIQDLHHACVLSSPLPFLGISPSKYIIHLISFWHLLLRGPKQMKTGLRVLQENRQ